MAEERDERQWDHTAELLALHANLNRDPKQRRRPFTADEFHPYRAGWPRRNASRVDQRVSMAEFRALIQSGVRPSPADESHDHFP